MNITSVLRHEGRLRDDFYWISMEYYPLIIFGCIIGMQHALEADHLAAIAALNTGSNSRRALVLRGSVWGLGHTVTLLTICGVFLLFDKSISWLDFMPIFIDVSLSGRL